MSRRLVTEPTDEYKLTADTAVPVSAASLFLISSCFCAVNSAVVSWNLIAMRKSRTCLHLKPALHLQWVASDDPSGLLVLLGQPNCCPPLQ